MSSIWWYRVRYGDEYQEERTTPSRSRGRDGHVRKSFRSTKEEEVFLRVSGRFQQGVVAELSPKVKTGIHQMGKGREHVL